MNENKQITLASSTNTATPVETPIIARLTSKEHLHAREIEIEGESARRLTSSLFYATNVEFLSQFGRRLRYLETISDWNRFETATNGDYDCVEGYVERALTCTRDRSIDEIIARAFTFDDERQNVSFAQVLIGLCIIGIASKGFDRADIDPDKWDRRFRSLFFMAYMIAHECACFVKYSAQYTDGEALGSRCKIDAADLVERLERLHVYLNEELVEG